MYDRIESVLYLYIYCFCSVCRNFQAMFALEINNIVRRIRL